MHPECKSSDPSFSRRRLLSASTIIMICFTIQWWYPISCCCAVIYVEGCIAQYHASNGGTAAAPVFIV